MKVEDFDEIAALEALIKGMDLLQAQIVEVKAAFAAWCESPGYVLDNKCNETPEWLRLDAAIAAMNTGELVFNKEEGNGHVGCESVAVGEGVVAGCGGAGGAD